MPMVQLLPLLQSIISMHFDAGIDHVWDLELYGRLLETGGGKERMTAYFTVCMPTSLCALAIKTPAQ